MALTFALHLSSWRRPGDSAGPLALPGGYRQSLRELPAPASLAGILAAAALRLSQTEQEGFWCQFWGSLRLVQALRLMTSAGSRVCRPLDPCHLPLLFLLCHLLLLPAQCRLQGQSPRWRRSSEPWEGAAPSTQALPAEVQGPGQSEASVSELSQPQKSRQPDITSHLAQETGPRGRVGQHFHGPGINEDLHGRLLF